MATQVVMPKLSPTMEEGQLSRWLKKEGDKVSAGEPLAEIDTDKATMEAQALASGVLRKIFVEAGSTVPLGEVIAVIAEADEDISEIVARAQSGKTGAENKKSIEENVEAGQDGAQQELATVVPEGARTQATIQEQPLAGDAGEDGSSKSSDEAVQASSGGRQLPAPPPPTVNQQPPTNGDGAPDGRVIISPLAARMAAEANINLQTLRGSGPGGRIVKRDIEAVMSAGGANQPQSQSPQAQQQQQPSPVEAPPQAPAQQSQVQGAAAYREVPVSEMRRTIARRLATSLGPVPHFFLTTEIDMDKATEMRRSINDLDPELKVSINDFIIKVTAAALSQHPQVNASYNDKTIRYYDGVDIGVAVALEGGLITPIVRGTDKKSVGQIAREVRELAERARNRQLRPEEYMGATFSISNLGMFGIDEFTAIINPPEAAILAVGQAKAMAVVRDGEIVVKQIMRVTLSCDHRIVDGATGAKFLQTFKKLLENPLYLLA
ncbi:MAG: pyruvate dehydrogenase complex dihydrolipoamide acetyltransferase [Pyrinomonadaceae bacterium]|nr:pyruvate dehydrogenase complex dihydrolipoamide acetyltransferase [Pyrinomonadaceae bacterium]